MKLAMFVLACVLVFVVTGEPKTIYVPDDYTKIQAAIDAAQNGDNIIVRSGTYVENIDFKGKSIALKSENGPEVTIIDGNQNDSVVKFENGEPKDTVIDGFTITNGNTAGSGGGIWCAYSSSPTIVNNIITGNIASHGGGVIAHTDSNPLISSNIVENNTASVSGGGIVAYGNSNPTISNNLIAHNFSNTTIEHAGGGGIWLSSSSPQIHNNIIIDNSSNKMGGGIYCYYISHASISNNTISGNYASTYGGGIACYHSSDSVIANSIIYGNSTGLSGPEIYKSSSNPTITYSDVKGGWAGTGNINTDPLWIDPGNGDYHLRQAPCQPWITNPCVDAGDPNSPMIEGTTRTDGIQDAGIVDMGYHYTAIIPFDYLNADTYTLSEATGGTVTLYLTAGASNAKRNYILLGSLSGTVPGHGLPGGLVTLPLNWDLFTDLIIAYMNSSFFMNFLGILDTSGDGLAILNTFGPMPPGMAGTTMSFAYALNMPWDFVSNPVNIEVIP